MRRALLFAALTALILGTPSAASADVVPAGKKKIRQDVYIDFGTFADRSTWTYVVKKGDTLSEIAQHTLGTMKRAAEITALNPGLSAETLKPDQKLVMPPRKKPTDADGWWDFYGAKWNGMGGLTRFSSGEALPFHHYGTRLYAIRHDKVADVLKQIEADKKKGARTVLDALVKESWVTRSVGSLGGYTTVSDSAPQRRESITYRVTGFGKDGIGLKEVKREQFDKDGKVVSSAFLGLPMNLVLLTLAFLGLLGLVVLVAKRSRASRIQIPVSPTAP